MKGKKLSEKARSAIRRSFYERIDRHGTPEEQARSSAALAIDLIELSHSSGKSFHPDWWEQEENRVRIKGS